ncbi:hypothetical protein [Alistipes ihumii]|uniref:hypothetical protein n=1 Tax=Alistipes ihumii TaxID=1470347 RepID=UPI003FF09871
MKGNKLFKIIGAVGYHARNKLQLFLEERSPRQRLWIVGVLFAILAAIDLWLIVSGGSRRDALPEMEHIENLLKP